MTSDGRHCRPVSGSLAVMAGFPRQGGAPRHQKSPPRREGAPARARPSRFWRRRTYRQPPNPSQANLARQASPQTMGGDGSTSRRAMAEDGAATRRGRSFPSSNPTTTTRPSIIRRQAQPDARRQRVAHAQKAAPHLGRKRRRRSQAPRKQRRTPKRRKTTETKW